MNLLWRDRLIKTGPVDYADWNYRPILGNIQRLRFSLALSLLPVYSNRLLEIGYGSGVFMPSLSPIADQLYGIDVHDKSDRVSAALAATGVNAKLAQAKAEGLPFKDATFDAVVAISSLEFISDLNRACLEICRILTPKGSLVIVTPGQSALVDIGLKILTGNSAKRDFGGRREAIIPTLLTYFELDKKRVAPPGVGAFLPLYYALRLKKVQ
jgi:ubiquinone/menaquinone biosynthesis C-methylase UbiE